MLKLYYLFPEVLAKAQRMCENALEAAYHMKSSLNLASLPAKINGTNNSV